MSCLNHIFVLNGIIHETLSSKQNKPVTIQIYDFTQMFDSMKLEEAISDLFDSGMKDDTLSLLYDSNRNIKVKVKTSSRLTAENKISKIGSSRGHMGTPHGLQPSGHIWETIIGGRT